MNIQLSPLRRAQARTFQLVDQTSLRPFEFSGSMSIRRRKRDPVDPPGVRNGRGHGQRRDLHAHHAALHFSGPHVGRVVCLGGQPFCQVQQPFLGLDCLRSFWVALLSGNHSLVWFGFEPLVLVEKSHRAPPVGWECTKAFQRKPTQSRDLVWSLPWKSKTIKGKACQRSSSLNRRNDGLFCRPFLFMACS